MFNPGGFFLELCFCERLTSLCWSLIDSPRRYGASRSRKLSGQKQQKIVTLRSHNDDRSSKFIVVADNRKKAFNMLGSMEVLTLNRGATNPQERQNGQMNGGIRPTKRFFDCAAPLRPFARASLSLGSA